MKLVNMFGKKIKWVDIFYVYRSTNSFSDETVNITGVDCRLVRFDDQQLNMISTLTVWTVG